MESEFSVIDHWITELLFFLTGLSLLLKESRRVIKDTLFYKFPEIRGSEGMSEHKPNVKSCSLKKCPELVWKKVKRVEIRICNICGKMPARLKKCPKEAKAQG